LDWLAPIVEAVMQRREFITFLGGAVAMRPFAADAQRRTARIGFFTPQSPNPPGSRPFEMACASEHILKDKNPDLARVDSSKRINYLLTTFPQVHGRFRDRSDIAPSSTQGRRNRAMAENTQDPLLRRILRKTAPVPYVIWMAGLATITGSFVLTIAWLQVPEAGIKLLLLLISGFACLGGVLGLYLVRAMDLPLLATFGDVIEKGKAERQRDATKSVRSRKADSGAILVVMAGTLIGAMLSSFLITGHWFYPAATSAVHIKSIHGIAVLSGLLCFFARKKLTKRWKIQNST
jgi:hypothetical protein